VAREVLAGLRDPRRLDFNFGSFGDCRLDLAPA